MRRRVGRGATRRNTNRPRAPPRHAADRHTYAYAVDATPRRDQEYVSSFLAQLRAKAIESMHALLEADADDDDA